MLNTIFVILGVVGALGSIPVIVGFNRWRQGLSISSIEEELARMDSPDYVNLQQVLIWRGIGLALYFVGAAFASSLIPGIFLEITQTIFGLLALLSAGYALASVPILDKKEFEKRREILQARLILKKHGQS